LDRSLHAKKTGIEKNSKKWTIEMLAASLHFHFLCLKTYQIKHPTAPTETTPIESQKEGV